MLNVATGSQPEPSQEPDSEEDMDTLSRKDIELHISIVAWLRIIYSLILILAAAFVAAVLLTVGAVAQDPTALGFLGSIGVLTGGFMLVLALPSLILGISLLRRAGWSRLIALVLAVFDLALFPIGTVLGAYTLFVLLQRSAEEAFGSGPTRASRLQPAAA
jgi:hypothetical protein